MRLLRTAHHLQDAARATRRGAVLMVSFLILIVLLVVVRQIDVATRTDGRVASNWVGTTHMDMAIESALLEVYDRLALDAEGSSGGDDAGGLGGAGGGGGGGGLGDAFGDGAGGGGAGGEDSGPVDSKRDDWARVQRTEINGVELRVFVQDENSKFNVLSVMTENEDEADKAFSRLVRVIDFYRGGTDYDVDEYEAEQMAEAIRSYLTKREESDHPRAELLTYDDEEEDLGMLLTLREVVALEPFEEVHFRDFRADDGTIIHSLSSFLTVSTSIATREAVESAESDEPGDQDGDEATGDDDTTTATGAGGGDGPQSALTGGGDGRGSIGGVGTGAEGSGDDQGGAGGGGSEPAAGTEIGIAINVNTAPIAVLKALFDDRDVPPELWDEVLEYRNEEEEEEDDEETEPLVDEFGEEIPLYQIFENIDEVGELDEWMRLEPIQQTEITGLLGVESEIFSVYVTARRLTGDSNSDDAFIDWEDPDSVREMEESGKSLVKTVRSLVWRREGSDGYEMVPLERWEVIDYLPYEVLDFPDEER